MKKWLGFKFDEAVDNETGYDKKNFRKFANDFKKEIKKQLGSDFEVSLDKGYYYFSGFIKKGNDFVYYSIDDVRTIDSWNECILIRRAKHEKDYTGESNHYTNLNDFGKNVKKLF